MSSACPETFGFGHLHLTLFKIYTDSIPDICNFQDNGFDAAKENMSRTFTYHSISKIEKQKQKTKGKATKQAITAIMKKMIHAIYAILKNISTFNEKLLFKNA